MNINQLTFRKLEHENTPDLTCQMCGRNKPGKGMLIADIEIAVDAHFSIVLCDSICERKFRNHKFINEYLREQVNRMRKIHRMQSIKNMGKTF